MEALLLRLGSVEFYTENSVLKKIRDDQSDGSPASGQQASLGIATRPRVCRGHSSRRRGHSALFLSILLVGTCVHVTCARDARGNEETRACWRAGGEGTPCSLFPRPHTEASFFGQIKWCLPVLGKNLSKVSAFVLQASYKYTLINRLIKVNKHINSAHLVP